MPTWSRSAPATSSASASARTDAVVPSARFTPTKSGSSMKSKQIAALAAVLLAAPAAHAGELTGNVGATSDYMFRGVDQTGGAAVQGGVDYTFDFGLYTGLWVSNSTSGGGNEADVYAG